MNLKDVVEQSDAPAGRLFAWLIQGLIVVSLVSYSLETLPNLSDLTRHYLRIIEVTTIGIFTLEYALRLAAADKPLKFIFSFYGLIDLMAIAPFYLSTSIDLRAIRAFRLLRLIRILKLARYSKAVQRFHRAYVLIREELFLFFFVALILLFVAAVGVYNFEKDAQPLLFASIFHSLWWAVVTLTTVGYGDVYPITLGGRTFTFFILFIGLGIIAVPSGLVASALSQARQEESEKENRKVRRPR